MNKSCLPVLILLLLLSSCIKENSYVARPHLQPGLSIVMSGADSAQFLAVESYHHELYSFGGVAGWYFGSVSGFRLKGNRLFSILLGTGKSTSNHIEGADLATLVHPGSRSYRSLGSSFHYPVLTDGHVEIMYTDQNGVQWCSTRVTKADLPENATGEDDDQSDQESGNDDDDDNEGNGDDDNDGGNDDDDDHNHQPSTPGSEPAPEKRDDQEGSEFVIEMARLVEVAGGNEGHRLEGRINCRLYEVLGTRTIDLTGRFACVVAPER